MKYISKKELEDYITNNPKATQRDIAENFEVTISAMHRYIKKYNIPWERRIPTNKIREKLGKPPLEKEELIRYLEEHPMDKKKDVANFFGTTTRTLNKKMEEYSIVWQSKRGLNQFRLISKDDLENYLKEHPDDYMWQIANYFNVSTTTIHKYIIEYKIQWKGINKDKRKIGEDDFKTYIESHSNVSKKQIAKDLGISEVTAESYLEIYNLKEKGIKKDKSKIPQNRKKLEIINKSIEFLKKHPSATIEDVENFLKSRKQNIQLKAYLEERKIFAMLQGKRRQADKIQELLNRGKNKQNPIDER